MERRFPVVLELGEDGYILAHCPDLPGCHSQGRSYEKALTNIREAIAGWLEVAEGKTPTAIVIGGVTASAVVH